MRKVFLTAILFGVLLSGCGTLEISIETTPVGNSVLPQAAIITATPDPVLSMSAASEEIRQVMLESATKWKSVWMDGTVANYAMEGTDSQTAATREQVWIDLPTSRFRVQMGPVDGDVEKYLASDGLGILEMDLLSGQSQSRPLPDFAKAGQFVPTPGPDTAYPQPLWGQMGTPLSQLAFTSDFAQSAGTFKPVTTEAVAGRQALVVDWTFAQNQLPSWRMWLDTETGVVLKIQTYDKQGGSVIRSEAVVNKISFNRVFDSSLFGNPSSLPKFSDVNGTSLNPESPAPPAPAGPDALHGVYFFVFDHNYGNEKTQLLRVPGSCAAGLISCPEAEVINPPSDLKFSVTSLVWSPDGSRAAFPYPTSADGNRAALFLFDPQEQTWTSIAEFNYIDPPVWSPDGDWLAFRAQDGAGRDEIYIVHPDGTGLANLSANENLPAEGQPYILNGWINNNVILRGRNDIVYLVRADYPKVKQLFDTPWKKSNFVPSPDGYFLAYVDVNDQSAALKLLTPDGRITRELAAFEKASIYPLVWAPDGRQLAFVKMTNDITLGQDLYIIGTDGHGLQQIYHSDTSSMIGLGYSPDGKYLIFEDSDAAGRHIYVIDLATMEKHLLAIPNLPLDWWWMAPSWQR
jgi:WD40 repeat protein